MCIGGMTFVKVVEATKLLACRFVLRCFRDPIRVPRIRENDHRVHRIRVPTGAYWIPNMLACFKNFCFEKYKKPACLF